MRRHQPPSRQCVGPVSRIDRIRAGRVGGRCPIHRARTNTPPQQCRPQTCHGRSLASSYLHRTAWPILFVAAREPTSYGRRHGSLRRPPCRACRMWSHIARAPRRGQRHARLTDHPSRRTAPTSLGPRRCRHHRRQRIQLRLRHRQHDHHVHPRSARPKRPAKSSTAEKVPEPYTVAAADAPRTTAYLYIVTWDDLSVTQGVLAQFKRDQRHRPDRRRSVRSLRDRPGLLEPRKTGPTQAMVNAADHRSATPPHGSSSDDEHGLGQYRGRDAREPPAAVGKLAVGEANDPASGRVPDHVSARPDRKPRHRFGCDILDVVRPDGRLVRRDAFHSTGANRTKAFLIFRLSAGAIIL